jgi:hypothetical protein
MVHVEHPSFELVENRPAVRGSGDENGRLFVHQPCPRKPADGSVQRFLVVVKLNCVVLMNFVHGWGV